MNQQVLIISNATLMLQIAKAVILDFLFITEAFFYRLCKSIFLSHSLSVINFALYIFHNLFSILPFHIF